MSDNDDRSGGGNDPTNVINFARRTGQTGFTLTPTTTMGPVIPPPDTNDTTPAPRRRRRSPLDTLAALPDPGLGGAIIPAPPTGPPAAPGQLPDTFRTGSPVGGPDYTGPRLGALSLAACLAVAVAAVRGTHTVLSDRRQRRLADQAETDAIRQARAKQKLAELEAAGKHQSAMQGIADKRTQQKAKNQIPSSQDFGRKSLGNRSGGAGGGGGGGKKPAPGTGGKGPTPNQRPTNKQQTKPPVKPQTGSKQPAPTPKKDLKKDQPKAPTNGKATSPNASSPSLERARRRQDRTDNRQAGRLQRRADRQAALLNNRAKDRDADRAQKAAARDAKGKVRDARRQAAEARREKAREAKFQTKQAEQQQKTAARQQKKADAAAAKAAHTSLPQALEKEARRRLKKRRKNPAPPVLTKAGKQQQKKNKKKNGKGAPAAAPTANTPKVNLKKTPKVNLKKPKKTAGTSGKQQAPGRSKGPGSWARAQAWARKKATKSGSPGSTPGAQQTSQGPRQAPGTAGAAQTGSPGGQQQAPHGSRRSPFANAAQAAAQAQGSTYTVTSEHVPGSRAKRWEPDAITTGTPALPATGPAALDAASTPHTQRPGTTRPKEPIPMPPASAPVSAAKPDPRITKAKKQAARAAVNTVGRQMDARHETEITLDDACDAAEQLTDDAFKTHEQSHKLSGQARTLRDAWIRLAERCATENNLIGDLFTGAAIRFGESMELVARMADEMAVSSLEAAEAAETAGNELNDAYRPYNVATADAGLTTPSAPAHNNA